MASLFQKRITRRHAGEVDDVRWHRMRATKSPAELLVA